MLSLYVSIAALIFAAISALFWALSVNVKFKFGYDVDKALTQSMKKASKI